MKKKEDKRVSFRVAPEAYQLLETKAKTKGLSVTAFVRMLALDAARGEVARG
jgi:uncharacterized protein (DUF1778 family)